MNILADNVDVELLRAQRTKLLNCLNPSDEIKELIYLLDYMLDKAAYVRTQKLAQDLIEQGH
mgnify:FL=1